jgi:putative ABC transport system permease protein
MRFSALLRIALRSLARNKMRSFLTMLGVIIGVAAVIAMLAVGRGAGATMESSIAGLGSNVINVFPGSRSQGPARMEAGSSSRFREEDVEAVRKEATALLYITPVARTQAQLKTGGQNWRTAVLGAYPEYLLIRQWPLALGAGFNASEERGAAKVCVIGRTVADNLFGPGVDPTGMSLRINNLPFRVLGVLESKGQNSFGQDQDDIVLAPFSTVQKKILGNIYVNSMMASAVSEAAMPEAALQITEILMRRLRLPPGTEPDFTVRTQTEIANAASAVSGALTVLLSSIAGISLLVGGIGIMNIMLVSVTERTREIGLRLAVGARGRDILLQFLVEAMLISLVGGLIGIALGVGVAALLAGGQGWAVKVSVSSVVVAFAFSAATGIFFGWWPARKAAQLNPIDALRYE